jgi:queuine/archaeosine tRNA-ribosyltransferase
MKNLESGFKIKRVGNSYDVYKDGKLVRRMNEQQMAALADLMTDIRLALAAEERTTYKNRAMPNMVQVTIPWKKTQQ